jgi:hypothetical protein
MKPRADRKAAKLQSAAQGLRKAIAEFLAAMGGCSPTKAKVLARQVLGDANEALGALEGFYEFVDQFPGSGLELVGLRSKLTSSDWISGPRTAGAPPTMR